MSTSTVSPPIFSVLLFFGADAPKCPAPFSATPGGLKRELLNVYYI